MKKIGPIAGSELAKALERVEAAKLGDKYAVVETDWRAEEAARRVEAIKAKPETALEQAGIPRRFWTADWAAVKDALPPPVLAGCEAYFSSETGGLFITGEVGVGKTHLAAAIARESVIAGGGVTWRSVPALFQEIRASFNGAGDEGRIVHTLVGAGLLILDDLGAEKVSDFTLDRLYLAVDGRYGNMRPIIVTSNLSLGQVADRIHDRLASRLAEMCRVVRLSGADRRVGGR